MPQIEPEIQNFVDNIGGRFPEPQDPEYELFSVAPRRGNYFVHPSGFMIIKLSRSEKAFWGVGKKHIAFLNDLLENYYLVLLESSASGYLLDKQDIINALRRGAWSASGNDYKINLSALPPRNLFRNTNQFIARVSGPQSSRG